MFVTIARIVIVATHLAVLLDPAAAYSVAQTLVMVARSAKKLSHHLHMLLFLQSLHQHATVAELLKAADKSTLLDFFQYKANTDDETYVDTKKVENNQDSIEADWKTHTYCYVPTQMLTCHQKGCQSCT